MPRSRRGVELFPFFAYFLVVSTELWNQSSPFLRVSASPCPNSCNQNGICEKFGNCLCFEGFTGADCSQRSCPKGIAWSDTAVGIDDAHKLAECSNRGECNRHTGRCDCYDTQVYEGSACERLRCPRSCNGNGKCVSMSVLAKSQDPGMIRKALGACDGLDVCSPDDCNTQDYSFCRETHDYSNAMWDSEKIYGCQCDDGFEGYDCSQRTCMRGDDPLTTGQVNEIQEVLCEGNSGTLTLTWKGETTAPISATATESEIEAALLDLPTFRDYGTGRSVRVTFQVSATFCGEAATNRAEFEFEHDFGPDIPLILADGSDIGTTGSFYKRVFTRAMQTSTKESDVCSNRGTCSKTTGICSCLSNPVQFLPSDGAGGPGIRDDCGYAAVAPTSCPGGPLECSGHGTCSGAPAYRCSCAVGRTGPDCSLLTCPTGKSWFAFPSNDNVGHDSETECSDMGICDQDTGLCHCAPGFEGAACDVMSCPGSVEDGDCHGNGSCLTMGQLARDYNFEGDYGQKVSSLDYGTTPNNPFTWDANRVKGCFCSSGWEGPNCLSRSCPKGDDPNTQLNQVNEVQTLTCQRASSAIDEYVNVSFGGSTVRLNHGIVLSDLLAALKTNFGITANGWYTDPTLYEGAIGVTQEELSLCRPSPSTPTSIELEFLVPTGDVPLLDLVADVDPANTVVTMTEETKGTKEYATCSNRGTCDTSTGRCQCFLGYGSSDGQGHHGVRGDCGYRLPYPIG